ncbi:MAG: hypothetical protein HC840_22740 [Leptolyngbyaceae cyanobacterium RM2_2_4]|nr:hypothetical protein [Leptolyngbyaceae cyanobacterium SM1_4_3]NJO51767.1 hypothetical protein [Leptolyngbyaceae cyanobacterium RM2_2_4]NJO66256.1 hypothetical protein [Leptolyngbyaceae cyanobacterium RM1_405_57]
MHRSNQYPEQTSALLLCLFTSLSSGGFPAFLGLSQVDNRAAVHKLLPDQSVAQVKFDQREGRSLCDSPLFLGKTRSIESEQAVLKLEF